ncbi:MAG: aquaporin [Gemmatimonadetes bacterium]|nr:aquaporin [Gemmatimonadota bacterium]
MTSKSLRSTAAEFFGTALFVFLGAGSVVMSGGAGTVAPLTVALAHGIALSILVTATLGISGGHLNPAVTAGLWLARKVDGRTAGSYVLAQLIGALLGAALAKALLPLAMVKAASLGTPALAGNVTFWQGVWIEAVLTFLLVSAVFGTAVSPDAPKVGGFGIGLAVFVGTLVGGPLTGAAMNPARAFGPAMVSFQLTSQAVYWIGPLLGSMAATLLWKYVLLPKDPSEL